MATKNKIQQWEHEAKFDGLKSYKQPRSNAWYDNWDRAFEKGIYAKTKTKRTRETEQEAY